MPNEDGAVMEAGQVLSMDDVDNLLAEAAALTEEVDGEEMAVSADVDRVDAVPAEVAEDASPNDATAPVSTLDVSTPFADNADAETEAAAELPTASAVQKENPPKASGGQAPAEWLQEADLEASKAGQDALPSLCEEEVLKTDSVSARQVEAVKAAFSRVSFRRLTSLARLPLTLLILLDKPFARLSLGAKNLIGCAAVGTLVVAVAALAIGSLSRG